MTRVLVLGGSGMVGHVVSTHLQEAGLEVTAISRRPVPGIRHVTIDLEVGLERLQTELSQGYNAVLNFAGVLNSGAEKDPARTIWLNSWFPHWLAKEAKRTGTYLIHMSTDCVFSGARGGYADQDAPDAQDLYGRSKALGEVRESALTIRTSVIGPDLFPDGTGLFNWFMAQEGPVGGYPHVTWTGVTTVQLAKAIETLLASRPVSGLVQLVNGASISKYSLLRLFHDAFPREGRILSENFDYRSDKSLVRSSGSQVPLVPSYSEMVNGMREWVDRHASLYPHYA